MRRASLPAPQLDGRVHVCYKGTLPEGFGGVLLSAEHRRDWIRWSAAKDAEAQGKLRIIFFEKTLVEAARKVATIENIDRMPGFVCEECRKRGIVSLFTGAMTLAFHVRCIHEGNPVPQQAKPGEQRHKPTLTGPKAEKQRKRKRKTDRARRKREHERYNAPVPEQEATI